MIRVSEAEARALGLAAPPRAATATATGKMNRTEARFARLLDAMHAAGTIRAWAFEAEKFRLADRTWWTPDFRVTLPDGRNAFVEVKARTRGGSVRWTDDGAVKAKTAPELHPCAFFLASYGDGGWRVTRLPSRHHGWIEVDIEWR